MGDERAAGRAIIFADRAIFTPATKHSVTIAGHQTSIRIESLFWDALIRESAKRCLPINALIAQIDAERLQADPAPNLASAIRLWLMAQMAARVPDA